MAGSDEAAPSGQSPNTISPAQCRAARALLDWSVAELAGKTGLDEGLVRDFEQGTGDPASGRIEALRSALMTAGIIFSDGDERGVRLSGQGGDEGVRLDQLTTENDR